MRRLRVSAATPHVATRTRVTGFSLFTQEVQREEKVLTTQNLIDGQKNMRVMAKRWHALSARRREIYNERARQRSMLRISDPFKKNNTFNLLMRLFGSEEILRNAGDGTFLAHLARTTMQAMNANDTKKLRTRLRVTGAASTKKGTPLTLTSAFKRFVHPHMMFFDSFTEMQRSVAPTRHAAFTAVSRQVSLCNISASGEESAVNNFTALSREETFLFAPISDTEAPFFEVFCATRCGSMDYKRFNILHFFMAFRGIESTAVRHPVRERVYRSLLSSDRTHDGAFFRARRCLEKLESLRSSDCGMYIKKRSEKLNVVPPTAYGIDGELDDVTVATLLAETRTDQSVYDDVLTRAALLRSQKNNALLDVYQVRLSEKEEPTVAVAQQPKQVKAVEKAEVADTNVAAKVEKAKKKKKAIAATTRITAVTKAAAKVGAAAAAAASDPARKQRRVTATTAEEWADEVEEEPLRRQQHTATVRRPRARPAAVAAAPPPPTQELESFGEDFLVAEEDEAEDVNDTPPLQVQSVDAPSTQVATRERRRTARSQISDLKAMLPTEARTQKLISKHVAVRKEARQRQQQQQQQQQPSPYVPPMRNVGFTESIRALLGDSV